MSGTLGVLEGAIIHVSDTVSDLGRGVYAGVQVYRTWPMSVRGYYNV